MKIYKKGKVGKKILTLSGILVLVMTLAAQTTIVDATNEATQNAETNKATSILIRNVANDADVATITFPAGAPSAVISNPTGNSDLQVLNATASAAAPVAILTSTAAYTKLWFNVTSGSGWTDAVASEKIHVVALAATLDLSTFNGAATSISVWSTDTETAYSLDGTNNKELFLQTTLTASGGKTGTSTFSVLGES